MSSAIDDQLQPTQTGGGLTQAALAADIEVASDSPRLVIRGESLDTPHPQSGGETFLVRSAGPNGLILVTVPQPFLEAHSFAALTDYLNITFPFGGRSEDVAPFLTLLRSSVGTCLGALAERNRGLHGWKRSYAFEHGGALFAFGGQKDTAFLSLPGEACSLVPDWPKATLLFDKTLKARITRWDGAVDDFEGAYTVDTALSWYRSNGFNVGGRKPSYRQVGPWDKPTDEGRTFYVGTRQNGKLMRIYEKGKQLGDINSKWVRWELELHSVDRHIPFDVLLSPGRYVAGAYPCLRWVSREASRIKTIQKTGEISYRHLLNCLSVAYGRMINVMMEVERDPARVVELLRLPGAPSRLNPQSVAALSAGKSDAI